MSLLYPQNFPGKNTEVGLPCPPPGDLPHPVIEPVSLMSPALSGGFFITSTTWEAPPPLPYHKYHSKCLLKEWDQ